MGPIMQARVSPAAAVAIFLLVAAHHLEGTVATASGGYEYLGFGGCRDNNGSVYSNIRLTDATATRDDSSCGQSCDVFRSSGTLRGFEWLIVNGSSKRCYCLFDAGSDVKTMALEKGGDGATWKGDNEGTGEISSVENVGIDSYCHKLVPVVRLGDIDVSPSPTLQPQSIEEIFEDIFGEDGDGVFTTSQVDDNYSYGYNHQQSASPSPTLNATKTPKVFAGNAGKTSKNKLAKSSYSMSMSMEECSKSSKPSSEKSLVEDGYLWSSGSGGGSYEIYEKKPSQSMRTKTTKLCSSKSSKGLSYSIVEGKADKGGDDVALTILEQMRYKMGNGGSRSVRVELLLMMTSIMVSSYLVW